MHKYLNVFVVAYLDNILVYSETLEDYIQHIKKVLEKFRIAKLLLKLEKCKFYKGELKFLRYIVRQHGI